MYYRPPKKRRHAALMVVFSVALIAATVILIMLLGIYVGVLDVEVPDVAQRFAPTPTPTRPAALYVGDGDELFIQGKLNEAIAAYEKAQELVPGNPMIGRRLQELQAAAEKGGG